MIWIWIYKITIIVIIGILSYFCWKTIGRILKSLREIYKLKKEIRKLKKEIRKLKEEEEIYLKLKKETK